LCTLNLGSNGLGVEGIKMLCKGLKGNHVITYLDISSNNIGQAGCEYLAQIFEHVNIKTFILERNQIGDIGAEKLTDGLREVQNCSITHLDIADNNIGVQGIKALCEYLKET